MPSINTPNITVISYQSDTDKSYRYFPENQHIWLLFIIKTAARKTRTAIV